MAYLKSQLIIAFALVVLALAVDSSFASIDTEPVKVTHRNSGPRYDIDDSKLTRTNDEDNQQPTPNGDKQQADFPSPLSRLFGLLGPQTPSSAGTSDDSSPIGHISIRRIFLVPVDQSQEPMRPMYAEREQEPAQETPQPGSLYPGAANPFFPFLHPPIRHRPAHPHLFGADDASRSPSDNVPTAVEQRPQFQGAIDPIEMMAEMMRHAMGSLGQAPDASGSPMAPAASSPWASVGSQPKNETKEEIVEMDGKKYLRKTVINRHVGENMVFMTKRLIFVPLNETETTTTTPSTTTTTSPESTTEKVVTTVANLPPAPTTSQPDESSTTTTSDARTEETTTTNPQREETTTGSSTSAKSSFNERLTDLVNKAEGMFGAESSSASTTTTSSTTPKPDQQQ